MDEETLLHYRAYLLRLWRDGVDAPWRASLERVGSDTHHHFADLSQLTRFLQTATDEAADEQKEAGE